MTTEEAAMVEPLSVAVYACQRGKVSLGNSIVIFGAGPIGILCGLVAKSKGAADICIVGKSIKSHDSNQDTQLTLNHFPDIDSDRLNKALELGAAHSVHCCEPGEEPQKIASDILSTIGSAMGPHCSMECSGADSSLSTGVYVR